MHSGLAFFFAGAELEAVGFAIMLACQAMSCTIDVNLAVA